MADPQPQKSEVSAAEIAQYSDAELDQYLKTHGRARAAPKGAPSYPVDLNDLSPRLGEQAAARESSTRASLIASSCSIQTDDPNDNSEEIKRYNELLDDGGRPSHPISLEYDVAKNLPEYREILSYWQRNPNNPRAREGIFSSQSGTWYLFRSHQRLMRKQGRFPRYYPELQGRLQREGFEQSFQLNEELAEQDSLGTWIEFLNFIYMRREKNAKSRQSLHDRLRMELVDSKVLSPVETSEESLWGNGISGPLQNEMKVDECVVGFQTSTMQSAERALLEAKSASSSNVSPTQLEQTLLAAESRLATAQQSLEHLKKRDELLTGFCRLTKSYINVIDDIAQSQKLVRWVLEQVPLVELEIKSKVSQTKSAREESSNQQVTKRNRDDEDNGDMVAKRRQYSNSNSGYTPDSRVLRRSSRKRRALERFS